MGPRICLDSARENKLECTTRRSVSIFSRRGTTAPKSKAFSICQAVMDPSSRISSSPTDGKTSYWTKKPKPAKQNTRGTILHAVPSEPPKNSMSTLEIAMATSPNEEILQAVGRSSMSTVSYSSPIDSGWSESHESVKATSPGHGSVNSRIGVWRDGVAFWDVAEQPQDGKDTPVYSSSTVHHHPITWSKPQRPHLSVVIPGKEPQHIFEDNSAETYRPSHSRPLLHVAPATVITRHPVSRRNTSLDHRRSIHPAYRTSYQFGDDQILDVAFPPSHDNSRSSISSNTIFQDDTFDDASCYSRCSSMTSVGTECLDEPVQNPHWNCLNVPKRTVSAAFSITSPVKAGVFGDMSAEEKRLDKFIDQIETRSTDFLSVPAEGCGSSLPPLDYGISSLYSDANSARSLSTIQPSSPTLSEAVYDLQTQLGAITEETFRTDTHDSAHAESLDQDDNACTLSRTPTLPKRSRRREWKSLGSSAQIKVTPSQTGLPVRRQSDPSSMVKKLHQRESRRNINDVKRVSSVRVGTSETPECAWKHPSTFSKLYSTGSSFVPGTTQKLPLIFEQESMCLRLMASSSTLEDLKALSLVNKTMKQVFQQNEMQLLRSVFRSNSPPAWELREWSPLQSGDITPTEALVHNEHTPSAYMSCIRHDQSVIRELKSLILTRCQSFLRPETVFALAKDDDTSSTRFDAAFYRIWSFCKIFGCGRGRENDLKGQLDWLRGGPLAHQDGCAATLDFNPEFDMDGVLLNPPDHFAKGNEGGLSAEQLYDMTEVWGCFATLMQGYEGRTTEAQNYGIFKNFHRPSAINGTKGHMLEEWIAYTLTLGPSVVLELSRFSQDPSDAGIKYAAMNGWTEWTPPFPGTSREGFLGGPVLQLYEEQLVTSTIDGRALGVQKRLLRRCQAEEIKIAHISKAGRQRPSSNKSNEGSACSLGRRDSALAPEVLRAGRRPPPLPLTGINGRMVSPAMWSPRKISPIIEDRVETFNRLSTLSFEGIANDTAERAIGKIVEMGFTTPQAKKALKLTDTGNGLRVDRALEWLLRQQ